MPAEWQKKKQRVSNKLFPLRYDHGLLFDTSFSNGLGSGRKEGEFNNIPG